MKEKIFVFVFVFFCLVIFVLALRGNRGNPASVELNVAEWKDEGPKKKAKQYNRTITAVWPVAWSTKKLS